MTKFELAPEMFLPMVRTFAAQHMRGEVAQTTTIPGILKEVIKQVASCQTVGQAVLKVQDYRDYIVKNIPTLTEALSPEEEMEMATAMAKSMSDSLNSNAEIQRLLMQEEARR